MTVSPLPSCRAPREATKTVEAKEAVDDRRHARQVPDVDVDEAGERVSAAYSSR